MDSQFWFKLLGAVLVVILPTLTGCIVNFLTKKSKSLKSATNSKILQDAIEKITGIVTDAVKCTNQTFVDDLKSTGTFTQANMLQAFEKTKTAVSALVSTELKSLIATEFGSWDKWLETKIESVVADNKSVASIKRAISAGTVVVNSYDSTTTESTPAEKAPVTTVPSNIYTVEDPVTATTTTVTTSTAEQKDATNDTTATTTTVTK
jgi:molybdopterin converting factor small subunit